MQEIPAMIKQLIETGERDDLGSEGATSILASRGKPVWVPA